MIVIEILTRVDAIYTTSTTSTNRNISTSLPLTTPSPASTPLSTPTSTPLFRKWRRHRTRKVKGLSTEELAARNDLVLALLDRIQAIPDGIACSQTIWRSTVHFPRKSSLIQMGSSTGNTSKETKSPPIQQEYEMRKMKQACLDTLKNMAHDLNEEMDRQVPLMDEIDTKVDKAAFDLKNANVRLKDTINQISLLDLTESFDLFQLRSSRNFCIDIILLCIILGIAAYLYNVLKN
ncbi:Syntaxin-71 [Camellia lanceoleosa]|uniref:Syntaxin-71 n=1 Tax=Camellia lanceoleosa TaxID=1840588 RepID=A0ACC0G6P7_9ERIC|nr:Syntaxin-71 [Camellia lanceoleosa]